MALIRLISLTVLICLALPAWSAGIELREFDDPVTEQRYRDLTASMRCPLCENQAIDDSDAPISADMRDRVYQLLNAGQSDTEIIHHMVQRFGDYVLYNPRLERRTYLLWGLPVGLLMVTGLVVALIVRARRHASTKALTSDEQARLKALIERKEAP
ncbi:cytochrome c-type biogenesis protein [Vreelandella arcis]|uniref:Cytochrome c-type biogenesis protein n=1 Tax=Vreelandella arcis TaxID=416873 RepID=A0A1H0D9P8_9GAMM|nr:cytochrome c-type biogenesis protein [Halomonas arcis]SDN66860.1 cytochrome c-type biogenesis protein CcmH [Halomonas arcis]